MRISDWSSDVCSSDLGIALLHHGDNARAVLFRHTLAQNDLLDRIAAVASQDRSRIIPVGLDKKAPLALILPLGRFGGKDLLPYLAHRPQGLRSEEHTYALQSLMRISSAVFCLKKKNNNR